MKESLHKKQVKSFNPASMPPAPPLPKAPKQMGMKIASALFVGVTVVGFGVGLYRKQQDEFEQAVQQKLDNLEGKDQQQRTKRK